MMEWIGPVIGCLGWLLALVFYWIWRDTVAVWHSTEKLVANLRREVAREVAGKVREIRAGNRACHALREIKIALDQWERGEDNVLCNSAGDQYDAACGVEPGGYYCTGPGTGPGCAG